MMSSSTNDPWSMYERMKVVGRGASGSAILCKRKKDNSQVVVKELLHGMKLKEAHDEYMNEIQLLSIVRHPNIIAYLDSFTHETREQTDTKTRKTEPSLRTLYIVMEYADGGNIFYMTQGTLDTYLSKLNGNHLEEEKVIYFFSQIAFALHHIHSHNILHRDLKTNNIMISASGKSIVLKIGDFGISKFLNSEETSTNTVVGTPSYLSPELCDGKACNEKSDIWAMGCILYEIMALHRMFEGSSLPALVMKITAGKYKPLPKIYSEDLSNLVSNCTKLNPQDRPNTLAIMGLTFLQDGLLNTQMTIGKLSLEDEIKFSPY
jgi:serine/threonine protein kinase